MHDWPHAPVHRFAEGGVYFITGATYLKQPFYCTATALDGCMAILFRNAQKYACMLQAWALFSNHYHLVVQTDDGAALKTMLARFHVEAAIDANARDAATGRKVWFQYWDVRLTYERSWLARLRYTHENAVHHGLVSDATRYRWCSASWFDATAKPSFAETVRRLKIDRLNVRDDFAAAPLSR